MTIRAPRQSPDTIAKACLAHLEAAVRVDSQSDESSPSIPSTPGQAVLGDACAVELERAGAAVERDSLANVIATLPGRSVPASARPLALIVHLDTSRGTRPVSRLYRAPAWSGTPIRYPARPELAVDEAGFPETAPFRGHDLVHGPGDAPFGLDNKLGLAQMLTLAAVLAAEADLPRPPLVLVARADEEIGRMAAVEELADRLAGRGVRAGYTLDGILPFEINIENFNAAGASIVFPEPGDGAAPPSGLLHVTLGGVNTHGATARAEGHRAATRLAAEIVARLEQDGVVPGALAPARFASNPARDCDGVLSFAAGEGTEDGAIGAVRDAVAATVAPHVPRGASFRVGGIEPASGPLRPVSTLAMLRYVGRLLGSAPGFPVAAEDSSGREGYTAPYRAVPTDDGVRLDLRLRDFDADGLARRERHLRDTLGGDEAARVEVRAQYVNMAPRLAGRPELVEWARAAGRGADVPVRVEPIRGGTGVDPFLDRGIAVANLGTGYFAPESEKEFTSLQMMARHVAWQHALVQVVAAARAG